MDNIEDKIDNITTLSQSQQDRLKLKEIVSDDLVKFLQSFAKQAIEKNKIEDEIDKVLKERINPISLDGEEVDPLSNYELIKLKEIFSKERSDDKGNLSKVIVEVLKSIQQEKQPEVSIKQNESQTELTQEDVNVSKKALELFSRIEKALEKTEISEEESEKN